MNTAHIKSPNLVAATDTGHIEKALESVPHVMSVEIDPAAKMAIVEHDGADFGKLISAVKQLGYMATAE
jgi:copper chaperone CopZ